MKKLVLVALAALSFCGPGVAPGGTRFARGPAQARRHDVLPLHVGSAGPRVAGLQWMLAGHRPNVFNKIKGTYKGEPTGYFGRRTADALYAYKYRLGYPSRYNHKNHEIAGKDFFALLKGDKQRTKEMVALAARRVAGLVEPGVSARALKIKLLEVSQLGVHESPWHSNRGPKISYQYGPYPSYQSSTGAYGAAWCASFQVWAFQVAGYGSIANRSAGVLYIEGWARYHGFLSSKPHVGSLVTYLDDGGHIGFISRVTASGYSEISGNSSDSVRETWHPWNYRLRVFINLPGV